MSPLDSASDPQSAGTSPDLPTRNGSRGLLIALIVGLAIGSLLLVLSQRERAFAGLDRPELGILVNGLDARTGRDLLLPVSGWVIHVVLPDALPKDVRETLVVTLREERTGTTVEADPDTGDTRTRYAAAAASATD